MGRKKTISDAAVLAVARGIFGARGHAASTRDIARAAGVSEAVLYQRFDTKERLFLAAMAPRPFDPAAVLGRDEAVGDPRTWIREVVERISAHYVEIVPMALQMVQHPSFDPKKGGPTEATRTTDELELELARRLRGLGRRGGVSAGSEKAVARLLVSLAHDRALRSVLRSGDVRSDRRLLAGMVDVLWRGLAPEEGEPGGGGEARKG
jgi:AcrR family transcriptional regulator